jgi:Flp pilus assembly protein TadD
MAGEAELEELTALVQREPRHHAAWHAIALLHVQAGWPDRALPAIQRALSLDRRNAEYLNTQGVVLAESGSPEGAIRCFRKAATHNPSHSNAHYNLGKLLLKLGQYDDALAALQRARKLAPERDDVREYLGLALRAAGRIEAAHRSFEEFLEERPDSAIAVRYYAESLVVAEGAAAARAAFARAVERFPTDRELRWSRARFLLAAGDFANGWQEYLWRPTRDLRMPPPAGAPYDGIPTGALAGKTVQLAQEQGIGDALFFCRYAAALRELGCRLTFRCDPKLAPILAALELFERPAAGTAAPHVDLGIVMDDLPALLKADAVAPPLRLATDGTKIATWKARLAELGSPPYTAVTWRAGRDKLLQQEFGQAPSVLFKRVGVGDLAHCLRGLPGTVVVLQRQPERDELASFAAALGRPAHDFSWLNEDLPEMIAFLAAIDEYVGVSNTNMHLAAGVGRTARVLMPHPAEWRWMLAGAQSPWFAGFPLYRQSARSDWSTALALLRNDLLGARNERG